MNLNLSLQTASPQHQQKKMGSLSRSNSPISASLIQHQHWADKTHLRQLRQAHLLSSRSRTHCSYLLCRDVTCSPSTSELDTKKKIFSSHLSPSDLGKRCHSTKPTKMAPHSMMCPYALPQTTGAPGQGLCKELKTIFNNKKALWS